MKKSTYPLPIKKIITILLILIVITSTFWVLDLPILFSSPNIQYGVTFSAPYVKSLGLDPEIVYQSLLTDLKVKKIRLPVYWNIVEERESKFNFQSLDRLLDIAKQHEVEVILAIGYKLPRWPECFQPSWALPLGQKDREEKILKYLEKTVDHFKDRREIVAWQIENEPYLNFGLCEKLESNFLDREVALVRGKDSRMIILTDSGELSSWIEAMRKSDIMGTTLYRTVYAPIFGFFNYPIPPLAYNVKAQLIKRLFAPSSQGVFITELQAEPWPPEKTLEQVKIEEQMKIFSLNHFKEVINYTKRTGFSIQYLWGVEWWYFMKVQGHPQYWEYAKSLF